MNRIYTNALAGLLAASVVLASTGCGQRSARFVSEPPESTPGWGEYESTQTEYESESETEEEVTDVRKAGADNPVYVDYDEADFPELKPGWYQKEEGWYYFDAELRMPTGWQEIDGVYYCFNEQGLMYADTVIDGWYLDADGKCQDEIPEGFAEPSSEDAESIKSEADTAIASDAAKQTIADTKASTKQSQTADSQRQTSAAQPQSSGGQSQPQIAAAERQTAASSDTKVQSNIADTLAESQGQAAADTASEGSESSDTKEKRSAEQGSEEQKNAAAGTDEDGTKEETTSSKNSEGETASRVIIHEETTKDEADEEETEKATYAVSDGHEAGLRVR